MRTTLDIALDLVDEPICLCLDKNPGFAGPAWHEKVWTQESILDAFSGPLADSLSVGIKLGEPSGLIDVEGDAPTSEAEWVDFAGVEHHFSTASWKSARGRHRLFTLDWDQFAELRSAGAGAVVKIGTIEFRLGNPAGSCQSVLPPYGDREWVVGTAPSDASPFPAALLDKLVAHIAASQHGQELYEAFGPPEHLDRPGDAYNESAAWHEILEPLGWINYGNNSDTCYWVRPGKTSGISATTGFCGTAARPNCLYIFSTADEVAPFEPDRTYSPFEALALTQFDNDFSAAARSLGPVMEFDVFEDTPQPNVTLPSPEWQDMICETQGFVRDFAEYHAGRSRYRDLVKGAMGGFLLQSYACGRKVQSVTGVRPNIDALMIAPSGTGKTQLVNSMTTILSDSGKYGLPYRSFTSGQAIEDALRSVTHGPHGITIHEEAMHLFRRFGDARDTHANSIVAAIKSMYSESSNEAYMTRLSAKNNTTVAVSPIDQPFFVNLFTGTPTATMNALSEESLEDGFFARLLVFSFSGDAKLNTDHGSGDHLLPGLVDHIKGWLDVDVPFREMPPADGISASPIDPRVIPVEAPEVRDEHSKRWEAEVRNLTANKKHGAAAVWRRAFEAMSKLELIIAASREVDVRIITEADTERAAAIVDSLFEDKIKLAEDRSPMSLDEQKFKSRCDQVFSMLTSDGFTERRTIAMNLHLKPNQVDDILAGLKQEGRADNGKRYPPGSKRSRSYVWEPGKAPGTVQPEGK